MKTFKKASLLLITLVTLFSFNIKSNAEECINGIMNSSYGPAACRKTTRGMIVVTGDNYFKGLSTTGLRDPNLWTVNGLTKYNLTYTNNDPNKSTLYSTHYITANGSSSYAFCLDPLRAGNNAIYAERFLLDQDASMLVQTYDAAVMSVMLSSDNYVARSTAIRLLTAIWGFHNGSGVSDKISYAYFGQAYNWINSDSEIRESYNKLYETYKNSSFESLESIKALGTLNGTVYEFSNYGSGDVKGETLRIFKQALNEAVLYLNKGNKAEVKLGTTANANVSNDGERELRDSHGTHTQISKTIVKTLNLKNFTYDGNASFILNGNGVSWKQAYKGIQDVKITGVKVNGKEVSNYLGVNLLQGVTDYSNITIDITINFTGIKETNSSYYETLQCNDKLGYIIDYTYNDSSINNKFSNYVGVVWKAYGIGSENKQRFITIDAVDSNGSGTQNGKNEKPELSIELIEYCDCSELVDACKKDPKGLNGDACKQLENANCGCEALELFCEMGDKSSCNTYDKICDIEDQCTTTVSNEFQCCDENNKVILIGEEKTLSITGPTNAVCFTNKDGIKDEAGNSYKDDSISNKYCSVSCKEDYEFYMPSSQKSNSGRYFTLGMKIKGAKTCYTSEIDTKQYEIDIAAAQKELVEAYNEYAKWKSAVSITAHSETEEDSAPGESCTDDYDKEGNWIGCSGGCSGDSASATVYSKYWSWTAYRLDGTSYRDSDSYESGWVSCGTCDCDYEDGDNPDPSHRANYEAAIKRLEAAIRNNSKIINDYNSCTTFNNDYNYDPEINYNYEDRNDYNYKNPNMETMGEEKSDGDEADVWYCTGSLTGSKYEGCSLANSTIKDKNLATSRIYNSKNYIYCDQSSCQIKTTPVYNKAPYIKKTAKVEATYRPKTLYYYVKGGLGAITKTPGNNTESIENGLPISKSTSRGIYHYGLEITNLGEFYNSSDIIRNGTTGRLSGRRSNSVLAQDEFKDMVNYNNGNINYDCSYLVNMGSLEGKEFVCNYDCPTCDYICVGPGCNDDCSDGKCDYICIGEGCIYNEGSGSSIYERQVSLYNLFPEGTTSRNWDVSSEINGLASKAKDTISSIENKAEEIYNEAPILSVTISPSAASNISRYNSVEEKNGGYSNETLSCYDLGGYESAACFSSFINEILEGNNSYGVRVNENTKDGIRKNRNTNVSGATGEYFEMWSGYNYKYSPDANEPSEVVVGPSWK